jgi:hypothetical protein
MRPGITWVIVGAVAIIGLFAGLDALRSSGGEPPPAEASKTDVVTTTQTETDAELEPFAELQTRRVVRLIPGRVTTNERFPIAVTFTVPPGWYGSQGKARFLLGMGVVSYEVDLFPGGITVDVLDFALADAVRRLEQIEGVQVKSPVRIGGALGRTFASRLGLFYDVTLDALGLPGVPVPPRPDLILLGAGRETLVIRRAFATEAGRAEVNGVLTSLRVTTDTQAIEQLGNGWALLFGAGQRCNRFMGQPACEWVDCERVGGRRIRNCTPVSSEVQRSFAGAVVREIVIRGQHAAARFSNGETVLFTEAPWGGSWSLGRDVNRDGDEGGKLFE